MGRSRFIDKGHDATHRSECNTWKGLDPFFKDFVHAFRERVQALLKQGKPSLFERNNKETEARELENSFQISLSALVQALDGRIFTLATTCDDSARIENMKQEFVSSAIDPACLANDLGQKYYKIVRNHLCLLFPAFSDNDWGLYLFYRMCLVRNAFDVGPVALSGLSEYFHSKHPKVDIDL